MNAEATYRRLESDADWVQSIALRIACFEEYDTSQGEFVIRRAESNRQLVTVRGGGWVGAFLDGELVSQMGLVDAGSGLARSRWRRTPRSAGAGSRERCSITRGATGLATSEPRRS